MEPMDIIMIVVAAAAFVSLIFMICVLYHIKHRKVQGARTAKVSRSIKNKDLSDRQIKISLDGKKAEKRRKRNNVTEEVNPQTGIRRSIGEVKVSHRRNHPDRIEQEEMWKIQKQSMQEEMIKQQETEQRNKLQMIYSPCTGESSTIWEKSDESKPEIQIRLGDNQLYAPVHGIIQFIDAEEDKIGILSYGGLEVLIQIVDKEKEQHGWTARVKQGENIRTGDLLMQGAYNIRKENMTQMFVKLRIDNYSQQQMLRMEKINYVSHGDKLCTIKG